jgi:hypothetical protein
MLKTGQTASLAAASIQVTGSHRQSTRVGVTVRACAGKNAQAPVAFTVASWSLADASGIQVPAVSDAWEGTLDPTDPLGGALIEPARCADLLITFEAPVEFNASVVQYRNAQGDDVLWRIA